ncbi:MAG: hypothetical protein LBE36_12195 [Flavobacteriaceae bacterium]|jgi:hypothetical protein|nr:hypothetical protein [Flavobacteriaceae bacterium]
MEKKNTLLYVICFPVFFHIITYYGFHSSYNPYNTWEKQADWYKGVYGYRILSREIVDWIVVFYNKIFTHDIPFKVYIMKKGTIFYHALFSFNMLTAVAVSLMTDKIFRNKIFFTNVNEKMRIGIIFFLAAILAFSQYVVYYDNFANFLFLITAYFSFKYNFSPSIKNMAWICILMIVSTLNKETACLNISLLAALRLSRFSKNWKDYKPVFSAVIFPVVCFVLTYLVLRIVKQHIDHQKIDFYESITLWYNLTGINQIIGWTFGILILSFIYYYALSAENKKLINRFLIFSSPYILMIFLVGVLWEIRLFIPLIFGATILAFLDLDLEKRTLSHKGKKGE